jgi:general secretion pathway protein G
MVGSLSLFGQRSGGRDPGGYGRDQERSVKWQKHVSHGRGDTEGWPRGSRYAINLRISENCGEAYVLATLLWLLQGASSAPDIRATRRRRATRAIAAGTTLLELMIACSILLVLATVALPLTRVVVIRQREQLLRYRLREMRDAIDRYRDAADKGLFLVRAGTENYPPDLDTLYHGVQLTGVQDIHIRFLRKIPADPMTGNNDWGLRAVQDDPDSTSWGGQDVFDVYSKATGTALDGTKYSDW